MKYTKKKLKNGLRIVSVPMKDNPTVTVFVLVQTGSEFEKKEVNGISHFLEHMCFKGTTKRPTSKDISKELDALGSHFNAFTSNEYTGYYAKADKKHLDNILDVVSDLYINPVFPEKEMEKEKGVIIEEINMYKDLPQRIVQEEFSKLLYGDQPAGWGIAGTKENIQKMKRTDLIDYRNKHYVASSTVVIVAGNFDEKTIFKKVYQCFKGIGTWKKEEKKKVKESQEESKVSLYYKDTDQTHLVIGVRTFDTYNKLNIPLRLIEGILSGGMSARLFQKMREEKGICYYVHADADAYTDHGAFIVSAGVDSNRIVEGIEAILSELKTLKEELVSVDELKRVKSHLIGSMLLSLESSDSVAGFLGSQEVHQKPIKTPEDIAKEIESVTAEQIRDLAKNIFIEKNLNLSIVGKLNDPKPFKNVLKI
jgi:predicted Zn-dependent peptidase